MNIDTPATPEQVPARLHAVERILHALSPNIEMLMRAYRGDPDVGAPPLLERLATMERYLGSRMDQMQSNLGARMDQQQHKLDTVVNEREDEKAQWRGIMRALKILGFTSVAGTITVIAALIKIFSTP